MSKKRHMTPKRLKEIRRTAGYATLAEFADFLGKSERWLQYRESGVTPISKMEAFALLYIEKHLCLTA